MSETKKALFKVDLQMFNDGGASGSAEGGAGVATENAPKVETKPSGSNRRSKSGAFDNVVFGKQEGTTSAEATSPATEGQLTGASKTDVSTTSDTLEARRKAYNDLISGEYKDLDQERFQQVFDRRFKQVKGMEADLAAQKPIIDKLMARYGVDDVAKLDKALTEDAEYWERVAEEKGMTVEQYHAMQKLEQENAALKAIRDRQIGQQQYQQQIDTWYKEAEKVKELYPSFDFKAETQNPEFLKLLRTGNSVEHAYKVLHFDELTNNAARVAAQTADAQAQARIKAKASRPSENGTSSQSAAIVKSDASSLTRAERAEIARRVQRGDIIKF
ncbi:MAG: hypothetical protein J6S71_00530 [Clostridia bacterium]|nr:hypothetical protein [Clostridia bacterium]